MNLRRTKVVSVNNGLICSYVHNVARDNLGKIGVLVALESTADKAQLADLGKHIAMHIAANNPSFVSREDISAEVVAQETEIIKTEALNENAKAEKPKPENIVETKIVPGRVDKHFKEICLLDQPFVKNPDETVAVFLSHTQSSVKSFTRIEVGEGIQKEVVDFAAEVAAQAGLSK
jgi:elongation factor Ts